MARGTRLVLGLNSGTSADGVDAVACEIRGRGPGMKVRVIGHHARRYPAALRQRLIDAMAPGDTRTEAICALHVEIGEAFASVARSALKRFGLARVDLVGSHGQTICHLPPASARTVGSTLQIGDPAVIAEALRTPVVGHFRQADMAAGGQGAPLVPWTDYVLFGSKRVSRVVQNIGGIANLTWLPRGVSEGQVLAFDSGPGNMLIDALMAHFSKGRQTYDRGGRLAAKGDVHADLLRALMAHPFLEIEPPKSCGREQFGPQWTATLLKQFGRRRIGMADWLATATRFTALAIAMDYDLLETFGDSERPAVEEVILCGGGAANATLVSELMHQVGLGENRVRFSTTADYGIPAQAKECVSFAMLAAACTDRVPANLPSVTGARRKVVLGSLCNPEST